MMQDTVLSRRNPSSAWAYYVSPAVFLTGVILGCALSGYVVSVLGAAPTPTLTRPSAQFAAVQALLQNGKLLSLIYLMAFLPFGAAAVPALLGWQGLALGCSVAALGYGLGPGMALKVSSLMAVRLFGLMPFAFLLGSWAIGQSLDGRLRPDLQNRAEVLAVTAAAWAFLSLGEVFWAQGVFRFFHFGV